MIKCSKGNYDSAIETYNKQKVTRIYRPDIYIKDAGVNAETMPKGMGVFAGRDFEEGEVVEFCHMLMFQWQGNYLRDQRVVQYAYTISCHCNPNGKDRLPCMYNCPEHGMRRSLPFGYGPIYNTADSEANMNTGFVIVPSETLHIFYTLKPVKKDGEFLTWWGQSYFDHWCKKKKEGEEK